MTVHLEISFQIGKAALDENVCKTLDQSANVSSRAVAMRTQPLPKVLHTFSGLGSATSVDSPHWKRRPSLTYHFHSPSTPGRTSHVTAYPSQSRLQGLATEIYIYIYA